MLVHLFHRLINDRSKIIRSRENNRRIRTIRERLDIVTDRLDDFSRCIDNDLFGTFFSKIGKFLEHLIRGTEIKITLKFRILKAHIHQHVLSVLAVFLIEEMGVSCRTAGFSYTLGH